MTQSELDTHALPIAFRVKASTGPQKVSLWFSRNVTRIRVSLGSALLYEGEPIRSIDALVISDRWLRVQFEWSGDNAKVEVSNFCEA
jgi:hypothetical protein